MNYGASITLFMLFSVHLEKVTQHENTLLYVWSVFEAIPHM